MPKKPRLQDEKGKKKKEAASPDFSGIHLGGEDDDSVQLWENACEIRKKITRHLKKPGVTQAGFCRDLMAQYHTDKGPKSIQSSMLNRFRSQKVPEGGNTSSMYRAADVFFEKLRVKEGNPKSKHREESEMIKLMKEAGTRRQIPVTDTFSWWKGMMKITAGE